MKDIPRAILWDLDGTIVDTKLGHFDSWQFALEKHGFTLDRSIFDKNFGRNNMTVLPKYLGFEPDADLEAEIINDKEDFFCENAPRQATLIPGVESWLSTAKAMNIAQAIASSAPMGNISVLLNHSNLDHYFDLFVSGANMPAKPEPDIFLKAASRLGQEPGECLVIEDSVAGIQAAKSAGMMCIAVMTSHAKDDLILADLVVEDFQEPLAVAFDLLSWQ